MLDIRRAPRKYYHLESNFITAKLLQDSRLRSTVHRIARLPRQPGFKHENVSIILGRMNPFLAGRERKICTLKTRRVVKRVRLAHGTD
jgi:hypothetical protein